ncbi:MAG: hypothetical protein JWQ55_343 [Rhodopila sp.]|nr:hypothetical protein [Rhodopila sp.]
MSRVLPQLLIFSYHKTGTTLFWHVMTKVSQRLGLTLVNHYGLVDQLDLEPDVILLPHSLLRAPLDRPYRAIRLIRDPRDIWVSGYLYHLHSDEKWCTNTDLDPSPPIGWPKVDHSVEHWPDDWKRDYLEQLNGQSYQQNLLDLSLMEGLEFELEGYTGWTFATMREWTLNGADALDVKLEDVMVDFDGAMRRIFDHFGFSPDQIEAALEVARSEDVGRMDDAAIADRPQINSRTISKWREVLSPEQIARFEERYGDLIRAFGYEPAGSLENRDDEVRLTEAGTPLITAGDGAESIWSRLLRRPEEGPNERGHAPAAARPTQDAGVWLSADGAPIRATAAGQGIYTFVVPSGRGRVRLESRPGMPVVAHAPCAGDNRCLGVRVSEIAIRSDAGDVVIAADNPNLTLGWHDVEHAGSALWRWTDGSAEVPWGDVSGPAVVTIRCVTGP